MPSERPRARHVFVQLFVCDGVRASFVERSVQNVCDEKDLSGCGDMPQRAQVCAELLHFGPNDVLRKSFHNFDEYPELYAG
jgi:hypothetical protein